MNTSDLLKLIRARLGWEQIDMYRILDIPQPTYNAYERAKRNPGRPFLEAMENKLGIDFSKSIHLGKIIIRHPGKLSHSQLLTLLNGDTYHFGVPVYDTCTILDIIYNENRIIPTFYLPSDAFTNGSVGLRMSNDSMHPEIRKNDIVICKALDLQISPVPGDIHYVAVKDGKEYVGRLHKHKEDNENLMLVFDHANQASVTIGMTTIEAIYKVTGITRDFEALEKMAIKD